LPEEIEKAVAWAVLRVGREGGREDELSGEWGGRTQEEEGAKEEASK